MEYHHPDIVSALCVVVQVEEEGEEGVLSLAKQVKGLGGVSYTGCSGTSSKLTSKGSVTPSTGTALVQPVVSLSVPDAPLVAPGHLLHPVAVDAFCEASALCPLLLGS